MNRASKHNKYHYNNRLREKANALRNDATKAEACLWKYVLKANALGYGFKRQRPVLKYIADFMCTDLMLIVEVDGITHSYEETVIKDEIRQKELESIGFTVLRFTDDEVLNHINGVKERIEVWINEQVNIPPPNPRQRGKQNLVSYLKSSNSISPSSSVGVRGENI